MKLLLTSAGLTNRDISQTLLEQLSQPLSENKVLIVAYAQNPEEEFYVNESKQEIQQFGFENIVIANMHLPVEVQNLGNFNVIYVCGGNTFSILRKLRETGLDTFVIQQVHSGAIYVGVSAGSIIAGPDIEIAGYGSEGDSNEVNLENLNGFNFADFAVFPHFHDELKSEVEEFRRRVHYKVVELTNDDAIFVNDSKIKMVGGSNLEAKLPS